MNDTVDQSAAVGEPVSTRLPADLLEQVDEIARRQHNSRSGVLRQALDFFFAQYDAEKPAPKARRK